MRDSDKLYSKALALFERSLDETSESREAWIRAQAGDDTALRDKALSYLSRDASAGSAFQTGGAFHDTLDDTAVPDQIGAYKITGLIGRGGMGAVYRGERASGDFDHDVAIKVVRPGAMSDKLVARFETERQTLAQLTHPHIARLYDGGTLGNGAPYIVMEFIDGLPITEWADKHKLSRGERLALFKAACSAVSYAHQNLIIHRDITPSNVLVDASGQVKLIDFGIAKPFDEDAAVIDMAYSLASLSFTPGFAAPERSKGAGANTLSDIYSLGKLLDKLTEAPQRDADLTAIIAKASELDPQNRYGSVDALIDDQDNYAAGYPVDARSGGNGYRFKKFVGRQKLAVSLGALVISGLIGGLIITSSLYKQAETARQFADQRFSETRGLTSFLIDELSGDLKNIPGSLPIREKINATSSKYLDILARAAKNDDSVRLDYAKGFLQLGNVMTASGGANLGKPEDGLRNYEASIKILRDLDEKTPGNIEVELALAEALANLAQASMYHLGLYETPIKLLEESKQYFDKALETSPDNPDILLDKLRARLFELNIDMNAKDRRPRDYSELHNEFRDYNNRFPSDRGQTIYADFLLFVAFANKEVWESRDYKPIPHADKELYELSQSFFFQCLEIWESFIAKNPLYTSAIYQSSVVVEESLILYGLPKAWQPTEDELLESIAEIGKQEGRAGVEVFAKADPRFARQRAINEKMTPLIETVEARLTQIKPFDGSSFTHIENTFYGLKTRANLEAKFRLNLDAGEAYMNQALQMSEAFRAAQPDFRNATLEVATTLTQKTEIIMRIQALYGDERSAEICANLKRAKKLWVEGVARWGEIIDYKTELKLTDYLIEKSACKT